jgi:hypothetical protein
MENNFVLYVTRIEKEEIEIELKGGANPTFPLDLELDSTDARNLADYLHKRLLENNYTSIRVRIHGRLVIS